MTKINYFTALFISILFLVIGKILEENNDYYFYFWFLGFIHSFDKLVEIYYKTVKNDK